MKRITHIAACLTLALPAAGAFAQTTIVAPGEVYQAPNGTSVTVVNPNGSVQYNTSPYGGPPTTVEVVPYGPDYGSTVGTWRGSHVNQTEKGSGQGDQAETYSGTSPTGGASGGGH